MPRCGVGVHQHKINPVPRMTVRRAAKQVANFVQASPAHVGSRVVPPPLLDDLDDSDAHGTRKVGEFGRVRIATHHEHGTPTDMVRPSGTEQHTARTGQHVPLRHRDELGVLPISPMDEPSA